MPQPDDTEYWLFIKFRIRKHEQKHHEEAVRKASIGYCAFELTMAEGARARTEEALQELANYRDNGEIRGIYAIHVDSRDYQEGEA